jgi:hypothetical protein
MAFNVFYAVSRAGEIEVKTYLFVPVPEAEALKQAEIFEKKYYNRPYPNGEGRYPFSKPWIGRV